MLTSSFLALGLAVASTLRAARWDWPSLGPCARVTLSEWFRYPEPIIEPSRKYLLVRSVSYRSNISSPSKHDGDLLQCNTRNSQQVCYCLLASSGRRIFSRHEQKKPEVCDGGGSFSSPCGSGFRGQQTYEA